MSYGQGKVFEAWMQVWHVHSEMKVITMVLRKAYKMLFIRIACHGVAINKT